LGRDLVPGTEPCRLGTDGIVDVSAAPKRVFGTDVAATGRRCTSRTVVSGRVRVPGTETWLEQSAVESGVGRDGAD
jgi:hypothetical protein